MTASWIAASAIEIAGLAVMARGAHLESRGRLDEARRLGRLGGFVALAGSLLCAAVAPLALASGVVALLGGLSGKPRPSWWVAALLLACAFPLAAR
ncbi:MAG TPA: hypothetical protein VJ826_10700 [Candidatus Polarisedimenticolaceae bacterium]|nr:hypothetical protein [Candidatus Polarisedimenticolaceae bacterium]